MSFSALLFTAAAVAFFVLMVQRPPVDPTGQADATPEIQVSSTAATASTPEIPTADSTATNAPADAAQQAVPAALPDYRREQRLVNEIRDTIIEGEVLFLHDGNRNFMAIQTDADESRGGAIILHGRGVHADWEDTTNPLRTGLVDTGWTTLSLQMPVLNKQAKYFDYVPLFPEAGERIKAGIEHLKDQGISPIVLIAHSCGGHMAMNWLDSNGDSDIAAFVGLGMGATDYQQKMAKPFPFDKLQVPVFDVYGENEFPAVIEMAPERWTSIKTAGNPKSAQRVLAGADHYFNDKGDELTELVSTWLDELKL